MKKITLFIALTSALFIASCGQKEIDIANCKAHEQNCPLSEDCPEHPECEAHEKCVKGEDCGKHPSCVAYDRGQSN